MKLLNRSLPRAQELAAEFPEVSCSVGLMPELMQSVAEADVVFTASGSADVLVHGADLASMPQRGEGVGGVRRQALADSPSCQRVHVWQLLPARCSGLLTGMCVWWQSCMLAFWP